MESKLKGLPMMGNQWVRLGVGVAAGYGLDYAWEKFKLPGATKAMDLPIFPGGIWWNDIIGLAISLLVMFFLDLWFGIGMILGIFIFEWRNVHPAVD